MSVRSFMNCGSGLSAFGRIIGLNGENSELGLSMFQAVILASSLSLRQYARFGASLSLLDNFCMGSTLSLRSTAKFGGNLSI